MGKVGAERAVLAVTRFASTEAPHVSPLPSQSWSYTFKRQIRPPSKFYRMRILSNPIDIPGKMLNRVVTTRSNQVVLAQDTFTRWS